ncbi:MAG: protein kinase domain-containing protein, partial [Planctomycetota bacterium]
ALARELIRIGRLTKYQAGRAYRGKTKGLVLGDYVVLDEIGHGGMGQVYRARHRTMERIVALKVLAHKALRSPHAVERFHREVKAAARLAHPNIVTAYDAGEHEGIHYLVTEYVDGHDLAKVLVEKGPLPVDVAVDCTLQAARGLEYAHRHGVVHRDVKPANLLLDREGVVKILDMGLARLDEPTGPTDPTAAEPLTESGRVMGTYDYMAPEQAEDAHAADHRADVYSLGCTLYRILSGRRPYKGETPVQILLSHRDDPIPSLRAARDDVPPALDAVCGKMMAKRPEDRYPSMDKVIADLELCLARVPPPAPDGATESSSSSDSALKAFLQSMSAQGTGGKPKTGTPAEETLLDEPAMEETHAGTAKPRATPAATRWSSTTRALVGLGAGGAAVLLVVGFLTMLPRGGAWPEVPSREDDSRVGASAAPSKDAPGGDPKKQPPEPIWQTDWATADAEAGSLILQGRFGEAEAVYNELLTRFDDRDITSQVNDAVGEVQKQAKTAYDEIEARAKKLSDGGQFADARAALEPVLDRHGIAATTEAAKKLLTQIDAAEQQAEAAAMAAKQEATRKAAIERLRQEERLYAEKLAPAEKLAAAWDFRGALAALEQVEFEQEELSARLAAWRDGAKRLVDLKARIIAKINAADPRLKKSDLMIRGVGGEVAQADEDGITTELARGKTESLAWQDVGLQAVEKLVEIAGGAQRADDWLAAGVLALASKDPTSAEKHFQRARSFGAEIGPYLAPLAATALGKAKELLEAEEFGKAVSALEEIQKDYADISWFASKKMTFDTAMEEAKAGLYKQEAEDLFVEAAGLYAKKELFDLRPLVQRLRKEYPDSPAVTDTERKPSFAELEKGIADLGQFITVYLDGTGDFTSIQEAIDNTPPNSLIEIQDGGPYNEQIACNTEGLTLRGKKGCWPIITSSGRNRDFEVLVKVIAPSTTLGRLIFLHQTPIGTQPRCLSVGGGARSFRMNSTVLYMHSADDALDFSASGTSSEVRDCLILTHCSLPSRLGSGVRLVNCLFPGEEVFARWPCEFRSCTVRTLVLCGRPELVFDSIVGRLAIEDRTVRHRIENCDVVGPRLPEGSAKSFSADPQFRNPANLDYRLLPTSPCIGKASDGGDIGCRYTPEMIEMCKIALELRAKGIIKF